ncbi:MAG: TolC family protein [Acidobacteriota bacterium]
MRVVVLAFVLGVASLARADLLTRVLADADGAGGGGSGSSSPAADDLIAWAGEPRAIELPELLQIAVRQAPPLQGARFDIAVAEAQIGQTWARGDWHVQAQATGSKTLGAFAGLAVSSDQYGGTADIYRLLPTGGTIDLHVGTSYTKQSLPMFGTSTIWQDTLSGSITQPLLKGAGRFIYDANEQKARLSRDVAVLARRLAAINTVQTVVSAYWDLVLAERQVAITEQSLQLARERLRVTQIGAQGGKIAQAEIPAVEQIIATREEDVLNGELGVLNASIALRRAAGMPIGAGDLGLRVATDLDVPDRSVALPQAVERAYQASPELAELEKQRQSATIDIEVTENGLLPQLDAALSLGPTAQGNNFTSALRDTVEFKQLAVNGSLTFSRSLEQRDVRYRESELRAAREKLTVNAFDVRAQYAQGVSRAVAALELAKRRIVLSRRAIELAKENIRIETDRFNLGTRTNFDVLNRLEDLRQAELREAQALIDWHKAETSVQALTGDLLPTYGIDVDH